MRDLPGRTCPEIGGRAFFQTARIVFAMVSLELPLFGGILLVA
jgi:hypothetical protein